MKKTGGSFPIDKKIARGVGCAISDFSMIRESDRILVGLSGGKDSNMLAYTLARLRQHTPVRFELAAVAVDPTDGCVDFTGVARFASSLDIPFEIVRHPIFDILKRAGNTSACSLCANIRRGILANTATTKGCNVLALGHHLDDVVETVFLNLLYAGRFACFEPHMKMSRTGVRVIRPLIYVPEDAIVRNARRLGWETLDLDCEHARSSHRAAVKDAIQNLSGMAHDLRSNVLHALKHNRDRGAWGHFEAEAVMEEGTHDFY
ncbi:tRNA 2-thiocytidine(32) synthetase TtcA [Synergistaceae bacterium OttesenSCG-928-I11]|nr:tRNA 2-thiocytidine(32) synthetase TtcA [Synergistaceae bacterium OttesenSCG-928-I11]